MSTSTLTLEERIARLEAVQDIIKLKADYAAAVDRADLDGIVALFTEDAVWASDVFGTYTGRDEIRVCMDEPEIPWSKHFMTNPAIVIGADGTTASGRWYLWQTGVFTEIGGGDPTAAVMIGVYDEEYVLRDGSWFFSVMNVDIQHISDIQKGWVEEPMRGVVTPADKEA